MSTKLSIVLREGEPPQEFTVGETRALIQTAFKALRSAPRFKCATCRCTLLEGDECTCCKYRAQTNDEDICT